jgi:hypothetical protein
MKGTVVKWSGASVLALMCLAVSPASGWVQAQLQKLTTKN